MKVRRAALGVLLLWGCASHTPARPRAWEPYTDKGPLPVHGAQRSDPGPRVFRALRDDPRAGRLIAGGPEPDTVEVVSVRGRGPRVVLTYRRGADGSMQRLVVDPSTGARVMPKTERAAAASGEDRPRARGAPKREPTPSARQALECPIDPDRSDCRALCSGGSGYEWCR